LRHAPHLFPQPPRLAKKPMTRSDMVLSNAPSENQNFGIAHYEFQASIRALRTRVIDKSSGRIDTGYL